MADAFTTSEASFVLDFASLSLAPPVTIEHNREVLDLAPYREVTHLHVTRTLGSAPRLHIDNRVASYGEIALQHLSFDGVSLSAICVYGPEPFFFNITMEHNDWNIALDGGLEAEADIDVTSPIFEAACVGDWPMQLNLHLGGLETFEIRGRLRSPLTYLFCSQTLVVDFTHCDFGSGGVIVQTSGIVPKLLGARERSVQIAQASE